MFLTGSLISYKLFLIFGKVKGKVYGLHMIITYTEMWFLNLKL